MRYTAVTVPLASLSKFQHRSFSTASNSSAAAGFDFINYMASKAKSINKALNDAVPLCTTKYQPIRTQDPRGNEILPAL